MVHAFVMIKTAAGSSEELVDKIRTFGRVTDAHVVAGEYDVIAEVAVDEVYEVMETVSAEIRSLEGISDTKTYISLR